jgi:hypothetical protein
MIAEACAALESVLCRISDLSPAIDRDCDVVVRRIRRNLVALKSAGATHGAIAARGSLANTAPEKDLIEHASGRFEDFEDCDWEST